MLFRSPLPDGLEEEDGGGDRNVETVQAAEHRDADVRIGGAAPISHLVNHFAS